MPIRRHGNGFEVRVQHAGRRLSRTVPTRKDALELEAKLKAQVYDHRAGRVPRYALEDAVARWLSGEAKALRSYDNLVRKVRTLLPFLKGRFLDEIADVAEEVKTAGMQADAQPATINRKLAILRRVARLAFRQWQWLDRDVAGRIILLPGEEPRHAKATPAQARALMLAAKPRTRQAILWAALTGLRKGELQAVRPHHFEGRSIVLTRTKTKKSRIVPLAAGLDPKAFPYDLTERELTIDFRAAREAAGMEWLQFRDLRRTFGSWIVQKTQSIKLAQDLLGHTTPVVTSRHYAHLLDGNLRQAVKTLPNLAGLAGKMQHRKKKKAA